MLRVVVVVRHDCRVPKEPAITLAAAAKVGRDAVVVVAVGDLFFRSSDEPVESHMVVTSSKWTR